MSCVVFMLDLLMSPQVFSGFLRSFQISPGFLRSSQASPGILRPTQVTLDLPRFPEVFLGILRSLQVSSGLLRSRFLPDILRFLSTHPRSIALHSLHPAYTPSLALTIPPSYLHSSLLCFFPIPFTPSLILHVSSLPLPQILSSPSPLSYCKMLPPCTHTSFSLPHAFSSLPHVHYSFQHHLFLSSNLMRMEVTEYFLWFILPSFLCPLHTAVFRYPHIPFLFPIFTFIFFGP